MNVRIELTMNVHADDIDAGTKFSATLYDMAQRLYLEDRQIGRAQKIEDEPIKMEVSFT